MKCILTNNSTVALHGLAPKTSVEIEVDRDGVPVDLHWRRRVRDAAVDGCVSLKSTQEPKQKKAKPVKPAGPGEPDSWDEPAEPTVEGSL